MVDMPGLDSGIAKHDRAMRGYLHNSLAYILMFSADEPVVKKSVTGFLSKLRLRRMPVFIVLSKCDKVPDEDAEAAAAYLKKTIEKLLGFGEVEVYCIKAKAETDVTPLRSLLLRLEAKADSMRDRMISEKLLSEVAAAQGYIRQRLAGERIPVSELEGRERLQLQGERVSAAIKREERRFSEEKDRAVAAIRRQVFVNLRESKSVMLSAVLLDAEARPQADRLIIEVLAASVPSEFTSSLICHLKALSVMLSSDFADGSGKGSACARINELIEFYSGPAGDEHTQEEECRTRFELDPEIHAPGTHNGHRLVKTEAKPRRPRAERPPRPKGMDPAAKEVLDRFMGSRQIFDSMPMIPVQATRATREKTAQEALLRHVLPGFLSMAENCVINGIAAVSTRVNGMVGRAVNADYAVRQSALEDIHREKTREDSKREPRLIDMEKNLNMLEIIEPGLESAKGEADIAIL